MPRVTPKHMKCAEVMGGEIFVAGAFCTMSHDDDNYMLQAPANFEFLSACC